MARSRGSLTSSGAGRQSGPGFRTQTREPAERTCCPVSATSSLWESGQVPETSASPGFYLRRADIIYLKGSRRESTPWTFDAGWSLIFGALRPPRAGTTLVALTGTSPASSPGTGWLGCGLVSP